MKTAKMTTVTKGKYNTSSLLEIDGFVYSKREPFKERNEIVQTKPSGKKPLTQVPEDQASFHQPELKMPIQAAVKSRQSSRRSSIGLRGKRVSQALNGMCRILSPLILAIPHSSIAPKDYFSLIDAELSDPLRMRQLLLWCSIKAQEMFGPTQGNGKRLL